MTSVVSEFYGMTILMSLDPTTPQPHFNVLYEGKISKFSIQSGKMLSGELDLDGREIIGDWWNLHKRHLLQNWELLIEHKPLKCISPIE